MNFPQKLGGLVGEGGANKTFLHCRLALWIYHYFFAIVQVANEEKKIPVGNSEHPLFRSVQFGTVRINVSSLSSQ